MFRSCRCWEPEARAGEVVAWRLATQNGGDLHFTPRPGLPTRFVLTLPAAGELRLFQSA
jgi:hypothetical protein